MWVFEFVLAPLAWIPLPIFLLMLVVVSAISIVREGFLWLAIVLVACFALSPSPDKVFAATGFWFAIEVIALVVTSIFVAVSLGKCFVEDDERTGRTRETIWQVAAYLVGICAFVGAMLYTLGFFRWLEAFGMVSFWAKAAAFGAIIIACLIVGVFSAQSKTVALAKERVVRRNNARVDWLRSVRDKKKYGRSELYDNVWTKLDAAARAEADALPKSDDDLKNYRLQALAAPWAEFVRKHETYYAGIGTSIQEHVDVTTLYVAWVFNWPFRAINYLFGKFIEDIFNVALDAPLRAWARRGVSKQFEGSQ
jgi:hypothetical protein